MLDLHNFIDYPDQLKHPEWRKKRDNILNRDNHRCQLCGRGRSTFIQLPDQCWNVGINYHSSQGEISPISINIPDFMNLIHTKHISIIRHSESNNLLSISDNGIIGLVITKNIKTLHRDSQKINLIKHRSGLLSYLVKDRDIDSTNLNIRYTAYASPTPIILNVHHKRYIIQHKAWEYNDQDLITLCNECHIKIHKAIGVKVYSDEHRYMQEIPLTPCLRCDGTGYFPEYKHIEHGVCFRCRGARFEELIKNQ